MVAELVTLLESKEEEEKETALPQGSCSRTHRPRGFETALPRSLESDEESLERMGAWMENEEEEQEESVRSFQSHEESLERLGAHMEGKGEEEEEEEETALPGSLEGEGEKQKEEEEGERQSESERKRARTS